MARHKLSENVRLYEIEKWADRRLDAAMNRGRRGIGMWSALLVAEADRRGTEIAFGSVGRYRDD